MTAANLHSVTHLLPVSMQAIAARLGEADTLLLATTFAGQSLRIPSGRGKKGDTAAQRLADELGSPQLAARLIQFYPDEVLYIPLCRAARQALRDTEIHSAIDAALRAGQPMTPTVTEMARRHGLSARRVWLILKQPAPVLAGGHP